jgi:hypothetical protein
MSSSWKAGDLQFSIPSYANINEVTYFHLEATPKDLSARSFCVSKRYTHFVELQADLVKQFPHKDVPSLPEKRFKLFINHLYHGFIEQRRVLLETFMKKLSEVDDFMSSSHMRLFLETDRREIIKVESQPVESKELDYGFPEGTASRQSTFAKLGEYVSEEVAEVWIPSVKEMSDHTLFQIHCANGDKNRTEMSEWVALKRYADFVELDEKMKEAYPLLKPHLPPLPDKALRVWQDHTDPKFIEERKLLLENYLKKMIRIEQIVNDRYFLRFLNADFS